MNGPSSIYSLGGWASAVHTSHLLGNLASPPPPRPAHPRNPQLEALFWAHRFSSAGALCLQKAANFGRERLF